jgi:excisionase family DNA binding protein
MTEQLAERPARLHNVESVMERLSCGRSLVFELMASGELRSVKVGRRRLVSEAALTAYIEKIDAEAVPADPAPRTRREVVDQLLSNTNQLLVDDPRGAAIP